MFNKTDDLKSKARDFILEKFSIDLQNHPESWKRIYDLFKKAKEKEKNLGKLIEKHLINGKAIGDIDVMELMTEAHSHIGVLLIFTGDDAKEIEVTIFKKPGHLINEKCECSKEATLRIVASFENDHRYVYCCAKQKCIDEAAQLGAMRLFRGPRPLPVGPELLKASGAVILNTYKIYYKE